MSLPVRNNEEVLPMSYTARQILGGLTTSMRKGGGLLCCLMFLNLFYSVLISVSPVFRVSESKRTWKLPAAAAAPHSNNVTNREVATVKQDGGMQKPPLFASGRPRCKAFGLPWRMPMSSTLKSPACSGTLFLSGPPE